MTDDFNQNYIPPLFWREIQNPYEIIFAAMNFRKISRMTTAENLQKFQEKCKVEFLI
jgi:hypothetical protein